MIKKYYRSTSELSGITISIGWPYTSENEALAASRQYAKHHQRSVELLEYWHSVGGLTLVYRWEIQP